MASLSLDKEIRHYLPFLGNEEKQSILSQIKSFIKNKEETLAILKSDYIVQYNKELEEAEKEIEVGLYITQEDIEKESESW